MLDVHPPQHPAHSWRDFFIHIGTICLGLLIAIGLEQAVEALHRDHQRHELLEQLGAEHRSNLKDAHDALAGTVLQLNYMAAQIQALRSALSNGTPYAAPPAPVVPDYNVPVDHVWLATKASGLASLLPRDTVIVNSEIESLASGFMAIFPYTVQADAEVSRSCVALMPSGKYSYDVAHSDKKDVQSCIGAIVAAHRLEHTDMDWLAFIAGADDAAESGETDIDRINDYELAESRRWNAKLTPIQ